ncbi:glycerol kinase GlpK [Azohydromonas caseinilytica]|uniref:Glycerol kinase n=1 Tax=Azohydromonas caseinilytica TaxID=2728836 RepID=A0A848F5F6_9BURK|nr:glycerol kinase GlpK [Azohydromonas caseinilytica]NML13829.1 glycerol kinase GlpK [Azohydromonas caseinilytica]
MSFILALDQGTSSSRSIVFDTAGRVVALAQRELRQRYPQPGWVEHDPMEIWRTQLDTARQALAQAGLTAREVMAIGIANQRETTLLWERASGRPLHHAIVWQDRRGEPMCAALRAQGLDALVRERTGLVVDSYFSATKIRWLLDNVPGARGAAERGELAFGTVDSWLLWQLTGGHVHATDVSNASRSMLYDIGRQRWDEELLQAFDIPASLLPEVMPSSHRYGGTDAALFGGAIPVCGMAGDQQAALFGQACFTPGMAKNTYGTGCFLLMHTGHRLQRSRHGLIATAAAQPGAAAQYALEGSVFVAGAVVQWLRDGLQAINASSEVEALATSVPDSGGVMFVPAFTGLGAPYWDGEARGAILGLTRGSTAAHVARAAVESIAYQSAALLQAMSRDAQEGGGPPVSELRVDGGACVNDLLMQFQADLLGIPVLRPRVTETTALGAAYLAGLAAGAWQVLDELAAQWQPERVFTPTMDRARAEELMARWERAVRQATAA